MSRTCKECGKSSFDSRGNCLTLLCKQKRRAGTVRQNLERQIFDIIKKGAESSENPANRPIRELMQNADDAFSDRVHIKITKEHMIFENDGEMLWDSEDEDGVLTGTLNAILDLAGATKMSDETKSGEFGTGLRSTHFYSDEVEIHALSDSDGEIMDYVGICTPFTNDVDIESGRERAIIPRVLDEEDRISRRVKVQTPVGGRKGVNFDRMGVAYRFPWRKEVSSKSTNPTMWEGMLWDSKRIESAWESIVEAVPKILLGCNWLREAVVSFEDKGGGFATVAWKRDFNVMEFLDGDYEVEVELVHYRKRGHTPPARPLRCDITKWDKESTQEYTLFTHLEAGAAREAHKANYLPNCMIFVPMKDHAHPPLGSPYTPISLTIDSGNFFSPLAYLPPHESRTKILLTEMDEEKKRAWASTAMWIFCERLLPRVHEFASGKVMEGEMSPHWWTSLVARSRPEEWFGCAELDDSYSSGRRSIARSWGKYQKLVRESEMFPLIGPTGLLGRVVPEPRLSPTLMASCEDAIIVDFGDRRTNEIASKFLNYAKRPVVDKRTSLLIDGVWWEDHFVSCSDAKTLASYLLGAHPRLKLGKKLTNKDVLTMFDVLHVNPPKKLEEGLDKGLVPCIPDADGILRAYKKARMEGDRIVASDQNQFFKESQQFSELLPASSRIHPDFVKVISKSLDLKSAPAEVLAEMIDSSAAEDDRFHDLGSHPNLHRQISAALVSICGEATVSLAEICKFKFVPCLIDGKITVREPNNLDGKYWQVDAGLKDATWRNFLHRDFIFSDHPDSRSGFGLHKLIFDRMSWLELHVDYLNDKNLGDVRDKLKLHQGDTGRGQTEFPGNLVRSLVFGHNVGTFTNIDSLFKIHNEDGGSEWELDRWLGKKLTNKQRDAALESILGLIGNREGTLRTGLGCTEKKLKGLPMLKNAAGEWTDLDMLCMDLPPELASLFGKTPVYEGHKQILSKELLTSPRQKSDHSGDTGLGITSKITHREIYERVKNKNLSDKKRLEILSMMVKVSEPWEELREDWRDEKGDRSPLYEEKWVPRKGGGLASPRECIVPTKGIVKALGKSHPYFVGLQIDLEDEDQRRNAVDIGLRFEEDAATLLLGLLGPDAPPEVGKSLLPTLSKLYSQNDTRPTDAPDKRERLPSPDGTWEDGSRLCSMERDSFEKLKKVFSDTNLVLESQFGNDVCKMLKDWVLENYRIPINSALRELKRCSGEGDELSLDALWPYILGRSNEDSGEWPEYSHRAGELFYINKEFGISSKLSQLLVVDVDEYPELVAESSSQSILDKSHEHIAGLEARFFVKATSDMRGDDFEAMQDPDNPEGVLLALVTSGLRAESQVKHKWPIRAHKGRDVVFRSPQKFNNPNCLIPEEEMEEETVTKLTKGGVNTLYIPEAGALKNAIYQTLKQADNNQEITLPYVERKTHLKADSTGDSQTFDGLQSALKNVFEAMDLLKMDFGRPPARIVARRVEKAKAIKYVEWEGNIVEYDKTDSSGGINVEMGSDGVLKVDITHTSGLLSDRDLRQQIIRITNPKLGAERMLRDLLSEEELMWSSIDERLEQFVNPNRSHGRPLIEAAHQRQAKDRLRNWYEGCQVCGQVTPRDTTGSNFDSSASDIYKISSKYRDDRMQYTLGCMLYLCPTHARLLVTSGSGGTFSINEIDQLIETLDEDPSKLEDITNKLTGKRTPMSLTFTIFEKRGTKDGETDGGKTEFHEYPGRKMKPDHSREFRKSLAMYLRNKYEQ